MGQKSLFKSEFDQLWAVWANKKSPGQALITYTKLRANMEMPPVDVLIEAAKRRQEWDDWKKPDEYGNPRGYMPHLSTALNAKFWLDEMPEMVLPGPKTEVRVSEIKPTQRCKSIRWDRVQSRLKAAGHRVEGIFACDDGYDTLTLTGDASPEMRELIVQESLKDLDDLYFIAWV